MYLIEQRRKLGKSRKSKQISEYMSCCQKKEKTTWNSRVRRKWSDKLLNKPKFRRHSISGQQVITSPSHWSDQSGHVARNRCIDDRLLEDTTVLMTDWYSPVKLKCSNGVRKIGKEIKGTIYYRLLVRSFVRKTGMTWKFHPNPDQLPVGVETIRQAGNYQLQFFDRKCSTFETCQLIQYL